MQSFRELVAWQRAMDLVADAYEFTTLLPPDERFELAKQIKRSAVSVPSNIAEGFRRSKTPDFIRFLDIAQGSLAELETQVELAVRLRFVRAPDAQPVMKPIARVGQLVFGLRNALRRRVAREQGATGPRTADRGPPKV